MCRDIGITSIAESKERPLAKFGHRKADLPLLYCSDLRIHFVTDLCLYLHNDETIRKEEEANQKSD